MPHRNCQSVFIFMLLLVAVSQVFQVEGATVTRRENGEASDTGVAGKASLDFMQVSTRQSSTCPILIPIDLPVFSSSSSAIRRQNVNESRDIGRSLDGSQNMNRQVKSLSISLNIVGGLEVESNLRRSLVSLVKEKPCENGTVGCVESYGCTGTLIHPEWIMSAAHCFFEADRVKVFFNSPRSGKGFEASLQNWWIHPKFDPFDNDSNGFDLAVAKLSSDVVRACNRNRRKCGGSTPKVMDINTVSTSPTEGMYVRTIGFGRTFDGESLFDADGKLRQVDTPIVNFDTCAKNYRKLPYPIVIREKLQMCAGYLSGECDSCLGDSGGPVVAYLKKKPVLVGVTSFGEGCALKGFPGVPVRVSAHVRWLERLGVPFSRSSRPFPAVGPMCENGEFLSSRRSAVAECEKCPRNQFSVAPERVCQNCPGNLLRDTEDGSTCSCRRHVNFGINRRGIRCVRCRRGTSSPFGSNECS